MGENKFWDYDVIVVGFGVVVFYVVFRIVEERGVGRVFVVVILVLIFESWVLMIGSVRGDRNGESYILVDIFCIYICCEGFVCSVICNSGVRVRRRFVYGLEMSIGYVLEV